jgi:hypothetical protein
MIDPAAPVVPREPDAPHLAFYGPLVKAFNALVYRLPVLLTSMISIPLGSVVFLISSAYWSLKSNRRISRYENGLAGIQPGDYRVPLLDKAVEEAVDDTYEDLCSPEGDTETKGQNSAHDDASQRTGEQGSLPGQRKSQNSHSFKHTFPILPLAPYQFRVIDTLDSLGWRKYLVHIQQLDHSHAAIVVRDQRAHYSEG